MGDKAEMLLLFLLLKTEHLLPLLLLLETKTILMMRFKKTNLDSGLQRLQEKEI